SEQRTAAEKRAYIRDCRPVRALHRGRMPADGIACSTDCDAVPAPTDDTAIVEAIVAICDGFECDG
ncbi:hypothetical protein Q3C01_44745, partial [Bradyrhizobium sp. UFLA05-109]